jgi:SPP1 family predicted phage head-tail adaptor
VTVYDPYGAAAIGVLRHRLAIELAVDAADGGGGTTRAWQPAGSAWAMIEPIDGDARVIAQAPAQMVTHRVTLRFRDDIDGGHRFVEGARIFQVQAAFDPDGTRRRLVCLVEEVKA